MKLLFISNFYPPNAVGGYECLCCKVASGLAAQGHHVTVLTSDYGGNESNLPGQTVERKLRLLTARSDIYRPFECSAEERAAMNARNAEELVEVVKRVDPHVIFVWNLSFLDPLLLNSIERLRQPVVYLLSDNWLITFRNAAFIKEYFAREVFAHWSTVRSVYLSAARWLKCWRNPLFPVRGKAVFPSYFMSNLYFRAGFRFDESTVIHHGVNLPTHSDDAFHSRSRFVRDGEIKLLLAGRVVKVKGVHTAIEALPLIMRTLSDVRVTLTILGDRRDHDYLGRLHDQVANLGLASRVSFAAAVPEEELFNLFQQYDIYLFPSLYEPFSLTLIHALGAGIPTIASNAGGNNEIVRHTHTGVLFPRGNAHKLASAVTQLATDDILRQSLSESARDAAQQYSFGSMIGKIERFLENEL